MAAIIAEVAAFEDEFVWIVKAPERWDISRATLDRLIGRGELGKHTRPGDKRVYLEIAELNRVLRPKRSE